MHSTLFEALNINSAQVVAFVGAGGKTSAIWRLSNELIDRDRCIIIAPTTHILEPALPRNSITYLAAQPDPDRVIELIDLAPRVILAAKRDGSADFDASDDFPPARPIKLRGLEPSAIDSLHSHITGLEAVSSGNPATPSGPPECLHSGYGQASSLFSAAIWLIEADGARRRLLKAPADHEPAIPACSNIVVIVASLDAIEQPLNETIVHRWEIFAELGGARREEPITAEIIARVLLHEKGGLKNIPATSRVCVLLTQRDSRQPHRSANALIDQLLRSSQIERVIVASLRAESPVVLTRSSNIQHPIANFQNIAAIILAAGESKRFGKRPKQLLDWHGRSFVQIAVDNAIGAGLDPIIVVVGSHAAKVRSSISNRPVIIVENKDWPHGQSTSVRSGIQALPNDINAALFMPIDQPNLSPRIIQTLADAYRSTRKPIVVASVNGKRTTPTLFDRSLFAEIMSIEGDRGARELIDADTLRVAKVEIDAHSAVDINTLDDYNVLLKES
jgi:molybdenum cofactor cytidylyltransferase